VLLAQLMKEQDHGASKERKPSLPPKITSVCLEETQEMRNSCLQPVAMPTSLVGTYSLNDSPCQSEQSLVKQNKRPITPSDASENELGKMHDTPTKEIAVIEG